VTGWQYRASCSRGRSCTLSNNSRETMAGTLTAIQSGRSRKIHLPRIPFLPSRFASVTCIILLKERVPVYVSFFRIDLIRSLSHRCRPLHVKMRRSSRCREIVTRPKFPLANISKIDRTTAACSSLMASVAGGLLYVVVAVDAVAVAAHLSEAQPMEPSA
jgi:hypothetical protein